ncbi:MAG: hypothetical protein H6909_01935 [Rickettsiaceae bacterium]|nr:hypothetical protein [Rickettsiaceae bacterium]
MSRLRKQILLLLSSCVIFGHNSIAAPNLPPLPTLETDSQIVTKTNNSDQLETEQEIDDSINIDEFIDQVDQKITEKEIEDSSASSENAGDNSTVMPTSTTDESISSNNGELEASSDVIQNNMSDSSKVNSAPQEKNNNLSNLPKIETTPIIAPGQISAPTPSLDPNNTKIDNTQVSKDITQEQGNIINSNENKQPIGENPVTNSVISSTSPTLVVPAYDNEPQKIETPKLTTSDDSNIVTNKATKKTNSAPDNFVSDELKVALYLAEDDISLGKLTEKAKLDQMSFYEYENIFWQKYFQLQRAPHRKIIEDFINDYDKNFNQ